MAIPITPRDQASWHGASLGRALARLIGPLALTLSVMLGGVGTFEGPVLGSALIGAMIPGFQWLREIPGVGEAISPVFAEVLVFVVALTIVKLRPQGLISQGRI